MIGVPAVVVPAGFYASGLPFGLEFSARPWLDARIPTLRDPGLARRTHRHPDP
jgi:Asp-tRNA(Asn)/Glu-tRNA(Gln) amidotransferase A subunit family amidase